MTALAQTGAGAQPGLVTRMVRSSPRWLPWAVLAYTVARFPLLAGGLLAYGVDPFVLAAIEMGTAWPYGRALASIAVAVSARRWGAATAGAVCWLPFALGSYIYILLAAGAMPPAVVAVVCLLAGAGLAGGAIIVHRRVRGAAFVAPAIQP